MKQDTRSIEHMIATMKAFQEDGAVLVRRIGIKEWSRIKNPLWNWADQEYKPIPKPREFWVNEYRNWLSEHCYITKGEAKKAGVPNAIRQVRFIEVLEGE